MWKHATSLCLDILLDGISTQQVPEAPFDMIHQLEHWNQEMYQLYDQNLIEFWENIGEVQESYDE